MFHDNDFAITLVLLKKRAWDKPGWFIERTYVFQNPQEKFLKKWDKSYFILLKIYMKTNQVFKNIPVATSHKFTQLTKKNEKKKSDIKLTAKASKRKEY